MGQKPACEADKEDKQQGTADLYAEIEKRRLAEEALRKSEEKFRSLVENINDWVWEVDKNSVYTYASPQVYHLLGYRPEEILGKTPFDFMPREEADKVRKAFDEIAGKRERFNLLENELVKKDGSRIIVETGGMPIFDEHGSLAGYRGVDRDITGRKQAEAELAASKARADLYLDLMGHDIKNMNLIALAFLEIAHETLTTSGRLDSRDAPLLEKPLESVRNSTSLINSVQKLQHSLAGEKNLEKSDIAEAIRCAADDFSHLPGRGVKIEIGTKCQCTTLADELLKDVFVNLIGNAVKHSSPDRPLIVNIRLRRKLREGKKWCRATVEDNGPGIPDHIKEHLFKRFSRGQTRAPGTGLGLYIVNALVDHYGGRITVEDRIPGDHTQGTRFIIELPAAR